MIRRRRRSRNSPVPWSPLLTGLALGAAAAFLSRSAASRRADRSFERLAALGWPAAVVAGALSGGGWSHPDRLFPEHVPLNAAVWLSAAVLMVVALADGSRRQPLDGRLLPLLLPVSLAGIWACVPDTEVATAAFGASIPIALAAWGGWPSGAATGDGPDRIAAWVPGAIAGATLFWATSLGGQARAGALVGGFGCAGVLLVEPVTARAVGLVRRDRAPGPRLPWPVALGLAGAVHVPAVLWMARAAGLRESWTEAAALALPALAAEAVGMFVLGVTGVLPTARSGTRDPAGSQA
jgi:hypothetical protein